MSIFFDDSYDAFDYQREKRKLIDNLEYLKSMGVEEGTLYKKWSENLQYKSRYDSSINTKSKIWTPSDINDKARTIEEIENLNPELRITELDYEQDDWLNLRLFVSSAPFQMNPGRLVKYILVDKNTDKYLAIMSIGSDVAVIATRDKLIGWNKKNKFDEGKLNNTAIGTTIVPTQPFGYNFLGGKLTASMLCTKKVRDDWKRLYDNILVAMTTTSLYGQGSMYNGIPFWKSLGESTGKIYLLPEDEYYNVWHKWVKENRVDDYQRLTMRAEVDTTKGPVTGVKQKIASIIMKEVGIKASEYVHGYKRGVYFAPFYDNYKEYLTSQIDETQLKLKERLTKDVDAILEWWKPKAINRYSRLYDENKINDEILYYNKMPYMSWQEARNLFLKDVGR
jgi:hypothetical protein